MEENIIINTTKSLDKTETQQKENLISIEKHMDSDLQQNSEEELRGDEIKEKNAPDENEIHIRVNNIKQMVQKDRMRESLENANMVTNEDIIEGKILKENEDAKDAQERYLEKMIYHVERALEKGDTSGQYAEVYFAVRSLRTYQDNEEWDLKTNGLFLNAIIEKAQDYLDAHKGNRLTTRGKKRKTAIEGVLSFAMQCRSGISVNLTGKHGAGKYSKSETEFEKTFLLYPSSVVVGQEEHAKKEHIVLSLKMNQALLEQAAKAEKTNYQKEIADMSNLIKEDPSNLKLQFGKKDVVNGYSLYDWAKASMIADGATESFQSLYEGILRLSMAENEKRIKEICGSSLPLKIRTYRNQHVNPKTWKGKSRLKLCDAIEQQIKKRMRAQGHDSENMKVENIPEDSKEFYKEKEFTQGEIKTYNKNYRLVKGDFSQLQIWISAALKVKDEMLTAEMKDNIEKFNNCMKDIMSFVQGTLTAKDWEKCMKDLETVVRRAREYCLQSTKAGSQSYWRYLGFCKQISSSGIMKDLRGSVLNPNVIKDYRYIVKNPSCKTLYTNYEKVANGGSDDEVNVKTDVDSIKMSINLEARRIMTDINLSKQSLDAQLAQEEITEKQYKVNISKLHDRMQNEKINVLRIMYGYLANTDPSKIDYEKRKRSLNDYIEYDPNSAMMRGKKTGLTADERTRKQFILKYLGDFEETLNQNMKEYDYFKMMAE